MSRRVKYTFEMPRHIFRYSEIKESRKLTGVSNLPSSFKQNNRKLLIRPADIKTAFIKPLYKNELLLSAVQAAKITRNIATYLTFSVKTDKNRLKHFRWLISDILKFHQMLPAAVANNRRPAITRKLRSPERCLLIVLQRDFVAQPLLERLSHASWSWKSQHKNPPSPS